MPKKICPTDSSALYFVKAFAILAVVAAHTSVISYGTPLRLLITRMWDLVSTTSVGCFFLVGGILYQRAPGDSKRFWKRKLDSLIIPWVFCFALINLYRAVRGHVNTPFEYLMQFLGFGSWLYYISMYVFCLAFFKLICRNTAALVGCAAVSMAALLAETFCGEDMALYAVLASYMNPINWIGYFALGILLRKGELRWGKAVTILCLVTAVIFGAAEYLGGYFNYFNIYNFLFSVSVFFLLFAAGRSLASTKLEKPIRRIGSSTYCIYLLHITCLAPIPGKLPNALWKDILMPILGLAIMMILIELGTWITQKLPSGEKIRMLVGLR